VGPRLQFAPPKPLPRPLMHSKPMTYQEELSNEDLLMLEKERQVEESEAESEEVEPLRTLTSTRMVEAFRLIDMGLAIFDEDDPNTERSSRVARNVQTDLSCYKLIQKEKQMKAAQTTLFSFFQKKEGKEHPKDDASESSTSCGQKAKPHLIPSPIQHPSTSSTPPSSSRSSDRDDPTSTITPPPPSPQHFQKQDISSSR